MSEMNAAHKRELDSTGYVVIDGFIQGDELSQLREAAAAAEQLTRSHRWPHRRVVGKQFPPWSDADTPDSWGVQHLMHPQLRLPQFRAFYANTRLTALAAGLIGCDEGALQMELFNMLILPAKTSFNLSWHRDHVNHAIEAEAEEQALRVPHYGIQFNAPLYDDGCLWVVPGSHRQVRNHIQRELSCNTLPTTNPALMPQAKQVHLKAGQILFYNANILHCAAYPQSPPAPARATLHGSFGDANGGSERAVGVLQHGLEWMKEPSFGDGPGRHMWLRLLDMYEKAGWDEKGGKFSLTE
ncbi:hypothetical protein E3P77_02202 [Wallemia ichthyophaga]|uniref:Phytanoyl-CoA dioxygenase family protein n=1 Tax=Wallemia ichthyophaga TaxID=245174 RepID=A0A4T0LBI2_WALIC|nr:hypothetical protein E3P91_02455 [Wallemia ichthyophaga]TIB11545.1 hypothetical protein E3P90_02399 [Wallemia ichthyophaga]TIB12852.1 hypothetical protein E3P93_02159 [Wallemia ichthyophaga]TIB22108.1 hypothetical protein E3P89_02264 [Wallemia ichthyophaga]TIB23853.1 hypothetical protein E3P88_02355 [Wallemia ichthyophaga]